MALLHPEPIRQIKLSDADYPEPLKALKNPPLEIFVQGKLPTMPCISIVGTRSMTDYGRRCIEHIVSPLIDAGCGIISGLAFGVDVTAHQLAISKHGYTLAAIPSGLDREALYPATHDMVARDIIGAGGCLISEYPPDTRARHHTFLARNRLIAALGAYTLVIEAPYKSGALSTASHAFALKKPVGAVPDAIFSENSKGTHLLIQKGAYLVTSAQDILKILNITPVQPSLSFEDPFLTLFKGEAQSAETIAHLAKKSVSEVFATLTVLEMNHKVKQLPDGRYMPIMV